MIDSKYAIFQDTVTFEFIVREYRKGETYDKKSLWLITICNTEDEARTKVKLLEKDCNTLKS